MSRFIRPISLRIPEKEKERHATWLELFFDIIFAVIITELGTRLFHDFTYLGILKSIGLFFPVMWTWTSYSVFAARFDNDDSIQWLMTFAIMFAGVIMAIQIPDALEEGALGFTIGFLIGQISLLLLYSRIKHAKTPKNLFLLYVIGIGSGGVFWVVSLFFDPPIKFILWLVGLCIYYATPWIGQKNILSKAPLHPTYLSERFGSFTIIILGQTIASVVFGLKSAHWNLTSVTTSILSFILAIIIWGQYSRLTQNAECERKLGSVPFVFAHMPLIISLIVMGVCVEYYIINPHLMSERVDLIFSFAVALYILSFYLLQHITMYKHKIRGLLFVIAIAAMLVSLLLHFLSPLLTILGLDIVFLCLFIIQESLRLPSD